MPSALWTENKGSDQPRLPLSNWYRRHRLKTEGTSSKKSYSQALRAFRVHLRKRRDGYIVNGDGYTSDCADALLRRHSVDPDRRRRPYNTYRSLEAHQGDTYVGHNEDDGTEHVDYTKMPEEEVIPSFLRRLSCDDVMPTSGKIVVLSVDLLVKNAFNALVTNDIRSAPLWSTAEMKFVGMLTITDFVNVLRHYYNSRTGDIKDIENQTIATWRRITGIENKPIIRIKGSESLTQAAKILIQQGVHRLPVQDDSGNAVVFVMTKRRLLQYLQEKLFSKFVESKNVNMPSFFTKTIQELQVGTFEDIAVINEDTKVIDALNLFVSRKVSALPVLDDKGSVIDVFQKFDVFALAKNQTYHDLDIPIKSLDKSYSRDTTGTCTFDETLETVITKFVSNKFHRLVVVDKNYAPAGMISLSDVLKFLVVQPLVKMENSSVSRTIPEDSEGAVGGTEAEEVEVDVDLSTGVAHMKIGDGNKPDSFEETPETETPPDDE